jgi:uncharacterized protein (TIGR00645 family)
MWSKSFIASPVMQARVKLATAIVSISSIHLLKTFINAGAYDAKSLLAQTGIHITFLLSALAIDYSDRIMTNIHNVSSSH